MSQEQDRFLAKRFGIFNHFLYGNPSDGVAEAANQQEYNWNDAVNAFDVKDMARRVHETGAGYYCITVMQGQRYMLSPNAAFDRISGYKPGEACATRDLIGELGEALAEYDIDLFLYFTGDGPHLDEKAASAFGYGEPRGQVTMDFVEKWVCVLEEYAVRYGKLVKGWWIDGCYRDYFGYTEELLAPYYAACKKGNPDCLIAMNNGVKEDFCKYYSKEDFVAGEFNSFEVLPKARFLDGAQSHILAPLGVSKDGNPYGGWRRRGIKHSKEYMLDYVRKANAIGMPVTIDIFIGQDTSWDDAQFELLKYIGKNL